MKIGPQKRNALSPDNVFTKKLVIVGSSIASGVGASTYANSWAGKLTTYLNGIGWNVVNKSVSGNSTSDVLARFNSDVAFEYPDIVLISLGLQNESYSTSSNPTAAKIFFNNLTEIISRCYKIGAQVVLGGLYPSACFVASDYNNIVLPMYAKMSDLGIPIIDFWHSTVDPLTSYPLSGFHVGDNIHPNDAGHALMYSSIPLGVFSKYRNSFGISQYNRGQCATISESGNVQIPISFVPEQMPSSYTICGWFKPDSLSTGLFNDGNGFRLRNPGNSSDGFNINLISNDNLYNVDSAITSYAFGSWLHIAVSVNSTNNKAYLIVNGISTTGINYDGAKTAFNFMSKSDATLKMTGQVSDIRVYRTPLLEGALRQIISGLDFTASADLILPLHGQNGFENIGLSGINPVIDYHSFSFQQNGSMSGVKSILVSVPKKVNSYGMPGFYAIGGGYRYDYTGDGSTHSWVRSAVSSF